MAHVRCYRLAKKKKKTETKGTAMAGGLNFKKQIVNTENRKWNGTEEIT